MASALKGYVGSVFGLRKPPSKSVQTGKGEDGDSAPPSPPERAPSPPAAPSPAAPEPELDYDLGTAASLGSAPSADPGGWQLSREPSAVARPGPGSTGGNSDTVSDSAAPSVSLSDYSYDEAEEQEQPPQAQGGGSAAAAAAASNGVRCFPLADEGAPDDDMFEGWPDDPVLVRAHPSMMASTSGTDPEGRVAINTGRLVAIDSPLFEGRAVMYIRGLPSAPDGLFEGSKRKSLIAVQGRFKRPVPLSNLFTGQEFSRPARSLPPAWLVNNVLLRVARALCPSMLLGPMSAPYVLMPVIAGAQAINVARPGEQPDIAGPPVEDVRLMDESMADKDGAPLPAHKRKRHFGAAGVRKGRVFDTEHVYTFYLYQHLVDLSSYHLNMVKRFDLTRHLDGQPMQFMAKNLATGEYLFNFQIWHRALLPAAREA